MMDKNAVSPGINGMPRVVLAAPDGARAEIYLQGAHVTAWTPAGGQARLYLSELAEFREGAAIRGGIPVIFPQFSDRGPLPRHGFARSAPWELVSVDKTATGEAIATLRLRDTAATHQVWAGSFVADLIVSIGGRRLDVTLAVTNTGVEAFSFSGALHSYLHVADVTATLIEGLSGQRFVDQTAGGQETIQPPGALAIVGEVDRIYLGAPASVTVREPAHVTEVSAVGFPDMVVWNPGPARAAALSDLEPGGYRRMLCVEAAVIGTPVRLEPAERWRGTQSLRVRS